MTASVIISTYNGAKKISNILNAMLQQADQSSEVLVVIDGSTDNTLEVVKSFVPKLPRLKIIVQENKGRAGVRNRGAEEATGDILIFYDDDMTPDIHSVRLHRYFHANYTGIVSGNSIEPITPDKTDIQNYKGYLTGLWTEKYIEGITQLNKSNFFFTAANCSFKKETFQSLEGFDKRLTDAEDHDLGYRALMEGVPVFFDKSNRAVHYDPITCASYIKRLRAYALAHRKLAILYPERYSDFSGNRSSLMKRMVYRIFAFPFWVRWIDNGNVFQIIPRSLRYKFYDVVIQALAVEFTHIPV